MQGVALEFHAICEMDVFHFGRFVAKLVNHGYIHLNSWVTGLLSKGNLCF